MKQMTLVDKQSHFTVMVAKLILWAQNQGYQLTFGEAYRTKEQAEIYAKKGIGSRHSVHCHRLAVDFNLFINGLYQSDSRAYQPLGEYWESLGGCWGGRFQPNADGNHFSLAHNNVK